MDELEVLARVVDAEGAPARGIAVRVDAFDLSRGAWAPLSEGRSDANGRIELRSTVALERGHSFAPALRLVESGDPSPRLLAESGRFDYTRRGRSALLTVDFGRIDRLEEETSRDRLDSGSEVTRARFDAEIMTFMSREAVLRSELQAKQQEASAASERVSRLETETARAQARAETAEQEKARLEAESEALRATASRQTPIGEVAARIGAEADAANAAMKDVGAAYRVGKLNVTLRGTLGEDGSRIALANAADVSEGTGRFQDVVFDLTPERTPAASSGGVPVPDVQGSTESAARRALAAAGLEISVASRAGGASARHAVGQAIQQSPAAGADVPRGSTVIVVFAAP